MIAPFDPAGTGISRVVISAGDITAAILDHGAALQDVRLAGVPHALTLGSPDARAYLGPMRYFGAVIGPVANRIGGGAALIDGVRHQFERNQSGRHTLHSGSAGTHAKIWQIVEQGPSSVSLRVHLPEGEGGFPGDRTLLARYEVTPPAVLTLSVEAETTAPTLMMVAHHPYWNLDGSPTWAGHRLKVAAQTYLPTDDATLPTGAVLPVANTPFDFRTSKEPQGSFDNSLCLARERRDVTHAASLTGAAGLTLDLATTEPALHLYDGHGIGNGGFTGHDGQRYGLRAALALEPQFWPDAPNHPDFPPILLRPRETWRQVTRYSFRQ